MEKTNTRKKKRNLITILLIVLISVAVVVLGFSVYKLIDINRSYEKASALYSDIEALVAAPAKADIVSNEVTTVNLSGVQLNPEETVADSENRVEDGSDGSDDTPENNEKKVFIDGYRYIVSNCFNNFRTASMSWNFDALYDYCEDSVGYIFQKDTMSYPIVQADDNEKYLRHMINGEYNVAGTLFVDYRYDEGLEGRYSIIYGHNMDDGSMFGSVTHYDTEEYYKTHPWMEVYIGEDQYLYYVYAAARVEEDSDIFTFDDMDNETFFNIMKELKELTPYETNPVHLTEDSHVIILSTCIDYPRNYDYRYVVALVRGKQLLNPSFSDRLPWLEIEDTETKTKD